jgi:hypothetical protein
MDYFGIDPGVGGGIACINDRTPTVNKFSMKDKTESEIFWFINGTIFGSEACAVIEKVSSSPQMGVVSAFTFGRSYGFLRGVLSALEIPYVEVRPQAWQKAMGCMTKGDKNKTKALAQQLYPGERVTHAVADALLLATYCRRHHKDLF